MAWKAYLQVLLERWRIVVAGVLLSMIAAALVSLLVSPQYTAACDVYLSAPATADASAGYNGSLLAQQKAKEYVQLSSSTAVVQGVARILGPSVDPDSVPQALTASAQPDSALVTVNATADTPQVAQALADAAGRSLVQLVIDLERPVEVDGQPSGRPGVTARVVAPAALPTSPTSSGVLSNMVLGAIVGVVIGCGAAAARAAFDTSVRSMEDLERLTGAPCLGVVPMGARTAKEGSLGDDSLDSPTTEAFRIVRSGLVSAAVGGERRTIVLTGPEPAAGRTALTCNLAISIARTGRRVVIVEGDLRRRTVCEALGMEGGAIGLTDILLSRASLEDSLRPWPGRHLSILSAGTEMTNVAELLDSPRLAEVIGRLRACFDVVLIDAPPLPGLADSAVLASRADGVVLVCRTGDTAAGDVQASVRILRAAGVPIVGSVLLAVAPSKAIAVPQNDPSHVSSPVNEHAPRPVNGALSSGMAYPRMPSPSDPISQRPHHPPPSPSAQTASAERTASYPRQTSGGLSVSGAWPAFAASSSTSDQSESMDAGAELAAEESQPGSPSSGKPSPAPRSLGDGVAVTASSADED